MPAAYATIVLNDLDASTESEIEEFHALTRLIVFAKESAALLDAHQTVYCLDLALEQIATELRHRADSSSDIVCYLKDGISRQ
jgi:galactose-1-phosphate uridylyltransferase